MIYYNKDYELLDLGGLAKYYQQVVGPQILVDLYSHTRIEANPVITVNARRVPFAIRDVRSETLTVELTCRANETNMAMVDREMKRLLGYQRFVIEQEVQILNDTQQETGIKKTFNCTSFLEKQNISNVSISTGMPVSVIRVTGTILVTDSEGGAVMSNDIPMFAKLIDSEDQPVPLPVIYASTNEGFDVENHVPTGTDVQVPAVLTKTNKLTVQALYLSRDFDKKLLANIKSGRQKQVELTEVYDTNLTVSRVYNVLSVSDTKQAGAYAQYSMELQAYTTDITEV